MRETHQKTKYFCAALVAMLVLAGIGCDGTPVVPQCNNGPGNAIRTLGGTGVVFVKTDETDYDSPTYNMIISEPDIYIRWKTGGNEFGNHSLSCLIEFWQNEFGDDGVPVVIWSGGGKPVCGKISSLRFFLAGGVTAELEMARQDGDGLGAVAASVVLALDKTVCPTGECSGKVYNSKCMEPYAGLDNATLNYGALLGADLNFASLNIAKLYRADLRGTALSNAIFTGADLREANFSDAVLLYTDFTDADMRDVTMGNARVYQVTAPDGTVVDNSTALLNHRLE